MAWSSEYEGAYPRELWHQERALLSARRGAALEGVERPPDDTLGVALSGGGIRSATFSLGVFQALAGFGLVGRIDYLSTVSGGGYFGAFLGRLFSRREIQTTRQVEQLLSGAPASGGKPAVSTMPDVVRWLRENGRYLSPNGAANAGDTIGYTVTITNAPIADTYSGDMRAVTIALSWTSGDVLRSRSMTTFVSRYGLQNYVY